MENSGTFLIVNTDLDATLLDHHNYSWQPALEAINALKNRKIPIIFNSSKTLSEMRALATEVGLNDPLVCENGSLIAFPKDGTFSEKELSAYFHKVECQGEYWISFLGTARSACLETLDALRVTHPEYVFEGYADWSTEQVAKHTNLSIEKAVLSKDRHGTEPIHWHGTDEAYDQFTKNLHKHDLKAVAGGRFIHISSGSDKAKGLLALNELYQQKFPAMDVKSVALGDSPNDLGMLNAADIAVVIPNHTELSPSGKKVIYADQEGPVGWNTSILAIID